MNIYITSKNEERLRSVIEKDPSMTMSGLINRLLNKYWEGKGPDIFPEYAESVETHAPKKIIKTKQDAAETVEEVFPNAKPIGPTTYKKTQNWGA